MLLRKGRGGERGESAFIIINSPKRYRGESGSVLSHTSSAGHAKKRRPPIPSLAASRPAQKGLSYRAFPWWKEGGARDYFNQEDFGARGEKGRRKGILHLPGPAAQQRNLDVQRRSLFDASVTSAEGEGRDDTISLDRADQKYQRRKKPPSWPSRGRGRKRREQNTPSNSPTKEGGRKGGEVLRYHIATASLRRRKGKKTLREKERYSFSQDSAGADKRKRKGNKRGGGGEVW